MIKKQEKKIQDKNKTSKQNEEHVLLNTRERSLEYRKQIC